MSTNVISDVSLLKPFFVRDFHAFFPFHPELKAFCQTLSETLFKLEHPPGDIVALAFWLRGGHLDQMHEAFMQRGSIRLPRGLVFHFPPTNIGPMMVYSWICSLLVGNGNIIRLPGTRTEGFQKLLDHIFQVLERYPLIEQTTRFVQYGHDDEITAWISSHVDVRIIWGGDETIAKIRKIPLRAYAKDLAFPDRYSFGIVHADTYLKSSLQEQELAGIHFYNDTYWFDQSACSSPRLLFWVGEGDSIRAASQKFYEILQQTISQRHYEVSLGGFLLKQTFLYDQALSLPVQSVSQISNELTVAVLENVDEKCRLHCGQGLLYHVVIPKIEDLVSFVTQRDQTLTYYGFSLSDLRHLVYLLNGRGLTRIVPFGQALNFDSTWDGHDLFEELTQHVCSGTLVSLNL